MTELITPLATRPTDWNGDPVPSAVASFFLSGTTTPQIVYQDVAEAIPYGTTVTATDRGILPEIYSSVALKVEIRDADGVMLPGYPVDPVPRSFLTASAAAQITFNPTVDIPQTNVQDAIVEVQGNIGEALRAAGIGVTSAAVVIANLDSTTTASGRYRIDAGTTGTFPAGFTAANLGIVDLLRETATRATMVIYHGASERLAVRDLTASVWGAWREIITSNQTLVTGDVLYHNGTNMARLPVGAAGQSLRVQAGIPSWSASGPPDVILADQKASGTAGGTFTSGANQVRTITTEVYDPAAICALAANQFTLAAGNYYIKARAAANAVNANQLLLWNATDSAEVLRGLSQFTGSQAIFAELSGTFTVAAAKALELRHRGNTTQVTDGFGVAASFGQETYAVIEIWRL